jgi:predicted transposase YdaD
VSAALAEAIRREAPSEEQGIELLTLLVLFAGHRLPGLDLTELIRRIGGLRMLEETRVYKEIIEIGRQKGLAEGLAQGLERGLEQGRLAELRSLLARLAVRRLGACPRWLEDWPQQAGPGVLELAIEELLDVRDLDELRRRIEARS